MSAIDRNMSLAHIVLDHPECADALRKRRLDYCCRGALTLAQACVGRGIDPSEVAADLETVIAVRNQPPAIDPRRMTTSELVHYIVARHHAYLLRAALSIGPLLVKVVRAHGARNPNLPELLNVFRELMGLVEPHLDEEESVVFPELVSKHPNRDFIALECRAMRDAHLAIGEHATLIRSLSDDFAVPDWACGSYRALMSELYALEEDIFRHVHLERHVLMARFVGANEAASAPFWNVDGNAPGSIL